MPQTFINLTNHPSSKWSSEQLNAAHEFASTIVDIPFPNVPASAHEDEVNEIINETVEKVLAIGKDVVVHIAGEPVVTHAIVNSLIQCGIPSFASTTERNVVETTNPDGTTSKVVQFKFVQFRSYLY